MDSRKVLRMTYPSITSYNAYGSLLSIISHDPNTLAWIYSTFIRLIYDPKQEFLCFDEPRFQECPWVFAGDINRELIQFKWSNIIDFIVDCINVEFYLYVLAVDRFHIPESDVYHKSHLYHEIFIYGYDLKRKVLFCADNIKEGKYVYFECPISQFERAYEAVEKEKNECVVLFKYKDAEFQFDVKTVTHKISKYIYPDNVHTLNTLMNSQQKNHVFGQDIYDYIVGILEEIRPKYDRRIFHVLWEHKRCMLNRIRYMSEHRYLNNSEQIAEAYAEVERKSLAHRNMILKYNITGDTKLILRLIHDIKLIKLKEKFIIEYFLENTLL